MREIYVIYVKYFTKREFYVKIYLEVYNFLNKEGKKYIWIKKIK